MNHASHESAEHYEALPHRVEAEYPQLTVEHNHGFMALRDAKVLIVLAARFKPGMGFTVEEQRYVVGTITDGGVTNRLFQSSSSHEYQKGVRAAYPIHGRRVEQRATGGCFVNVQTC